MALILVADDDPSIREMLRAVLESRGHQVVLASDGVQMIEAAKTVAPRLIVADVMMPGAYGSAAYKALQEDPHARGIPVVFLTAVTPQQAAKVIVPSPKVRVLHKPLEMKDLLDAIDQLLGARP